ncbi:MAG: 3-dehydroquinate synthase [Planctomycetes bacterium]|nr:3-dehydroquinate synthase [Planctomycetota bacterium]
MRSIQVSGSIGKYTIEVAWGSLASLGECVAGMVTSRRTALLTDERVWAIWGRAAEGSLRAAGLDLTLLVRPPGEEQKSFRVVQEIYDKLVGAGFDRKCVLIVLGGGVLGDVGGFVAATYMRGIPYVQVPTTLLAQVDSSVGGKVAINHPRAKNLIGAFYAPIGVLIDPALLKSLPKADLAAGMAEVIKYGIIRDEDFFRYLSDHRDEIFAHSRDVLEHVIATSCQVKAEVVSKDEKESGLRMILNYGHTVGHALEAAEGYGRYRHGEMVSIGMMAAARMSERLGIAAPGLVEQHAQVLSRFGLPTRCPVPDYEDVMSRMYLDKKATDRHLRFILATRIGEVVVSDQVTETLVRDVLSEIHSDIAASHG